MSRHTLISRAEREVVVGFDRPLRAFFGQTFDPSMPDDRDDLVAGWPTPRGLGVQPRIESTQQARRALAELCDWLEDQGVPRGDQRQAITRLMQEWLDTPDEGEPAILRKLKKA